MFGTSFDLGVSGLRFRFCFGDLGVGVLYSGRYDGLRVWLVHSSGYRVDLQLPGVCCLVRYRRLKIERASIAVEGGGMLSIRCPK